MSRRIASIALLGLLSAGVVGAATATAPGVATRVLELVNDARMRGHRCGKEYFSPTAALRISGQLQAAAQSHARDMARRKYFDHHAPDDSEPRDRVRRTGYRWTLVGENIAFGPQTAEEVVAGWLASSGHCANIMDPRFRDIGVGMARGQKRGHIYWVQEFGNPAR